jgi:hypothetical protein
MTSPVFSGPAFAFRASRPGVRGQPGGSGAGARLSRPESAGRAGPMGGALKICSGSSRNDRLARFAAVPVAEVIRSPLRIYAAAARSMICFTFRRSMARSRAIAR